MKIVLVGSYRKHRDMLFQIREQFLAEGLQVLRPQTDEVVQTDGWVRLAGDPPTPSGVQMQQLAAIDQADGIYVVNPGGYVGPSAMLECGYAYKAGIPIWYAETPYEAGANAIGNVMTVPHVVDYLRRT